MSTLKLRFTGLCALVPNDANPPNQVRVVMVNAADHEPVLVAFKDQVQTSNGCRKPDPNGDFVDKGDNRMVRFKLANQELHIVGAAPNSLTFDIGPLTGRCPEDEGATPANSLRWVASMKDINKDSNGNQHGRLIAKGLGPTRTPSEVIARFKLTQGRSLTTSYFAVDKFDGIVVWRFRNHGGTSDSGLEHALAEQVLLTADFDGTLKIGGEENIHDDTTTAVDPICLKPKEGNDDVSAWVANMPPADVKEEDYGGQDGVAAVARAARRDRLVAKTGDRDPDHHFVHFYDLVVNGGPEDRIPYPKDRCEAPGPATGNPKCPPVLLAPQAGA